MMERIPYCMDFLVLLDRAGLHPRWPSLQEQRESVQVPINSETLLLRDP